MVDEESYRGFMLSLAVLGGGIVILAFVLF